MFYGRDINTAGHGLPLSEKKVSNLRCCRCRCSVHPCTMITMLIIINETSSSCTRTTTLTFFFFFSDICFRVSAIKHHLFDEHIIRYPRSLYWERPQRASQLVKNSGIEELCKAIFSLTLCFVT